jgi:two-component system cell cycle response regulator DivK
VQKPLSRDAFIASLPELRLFPRAPDQSLEVLVIDAEAGLAIARAEQPALILMDIQLPGTDGLTAAMQSKADPATRAIPVTALTAFAMKGDEARIHAAGCDGYIGKPMRCREFLSTTSAFVAGTGATGAPSAGAWGACAKLANWARHQ